MLKLKVVNGPILKGSSYDLERGQVVMLGREINCDIRLPVDGVSKRHCQLQVINDGKMELKDLGSSNGTFVNGLLVKKHNLKAGDTIQIAGFALQVVIGAPKALSIVQNSAEVAEYSNNESPELPGEHVEQSTELNAKQKAEKWLQENTYPLIDSVIDNFDIKLTISALVMLWTFVVIIVTVYPFSNQSNQKIISSSLQTAKLYARQLVRINQKAILDQRYRDLIDSLDEIKGQTPGVLDSYILDSQRGQILAPSELAGNGLPNRFAAKAILAESYWEHYDEQSKTAYVSAPILVGSADGKNVVEATVFVEYMPHRFDFSVSLSSIQKAFELVRIF